MNKDQIKQEQLKLNQTYGFNLAVDGVLGPQTKAAMDKAAIMDQQKHLNDTYQAGLLIDGVWGPKSQSAYDKATALEKTKNDATKKVQETGQEYDTKEWDTALAKNLADIAPGYAEAEVAGKGDVISSLGSDQAAYDEYLRTQGDKFQTEKTGLDQTAANQGVLFSGGRVQKQNKLASDYSAADTYKRSQFSSQMGDTARKFESTYGTPAANELSKYYNLSTGNTYDPNVATGGASKIGGLSSVYSTGNFVGTQPNAKLAAAKVAAANAIAANKNKTVSGGYLNKF